MSREELDYAMKFNVSAIFTFLCKNKFMYLKVMDDLKDVYSLCLDDVDPLTGEMKEDYLYFLFKYNSTTDDILEDLDYISKTYSNDLIIVKVDKWLYMSKLEWELMKKSNYYEFKDIIYEYSKHNRGITLQHFIITKNPSLLVDISNYIEDDNIKELNIFWKAFNIEEEVLDLKKITDMTILGYKKAWLLEQLDRATSIDRAIYQRILDNSFELNAPEVNGLQAKNKTENDFSDIYESLKIKLKELTNKEQYRLEIKGVKYNYLPNLVDFNQRMAKACKKYELSDRDKVKRCLLKHIETLQSPLVKYYIEKQGSGSPLADDYNLSHEEEIIKTTIETKTLF